MSANNKGLKRTPDPRETDESLTTTQERLLKTQGQFVDAVMTMQAPVSHAMRNNVEFFTGLLGTGRRIAPFDKLLEIQFNFVHRLFDAQFALATMVLDAQRQFVQMPLSADRTTTLRTSTRSAVDLDRPPADRRVVASTIQ
jgi:hypothetical protein